MHTTHVSELIHMHTNIGIYAHTKVMGSGNYPKLPYPCAAIFIACPSHENVLQISSMVNLKTLSMSIYFISTMEFFLPRMVRSIEVS